MKTKVLTLLRSYALALFFLFVMCASFAQERFIARGAEPGEMYISGYWYGIYPPGWGPPFYDTARYAVFRMTENGKKIAVQYSVDEINEYSNAVMIPQFILADAAPGVVYSVYHYSKNSYPHTQLWVSFDYGKNWIFREEDIRTKHYYSTNFEGLIYRAGAGGFISNDYTSTWNLIHNLNIITHSESLHEKYKHIGISGNLPTDPFKLYYTDDFYQTFTEEQLDTLYVFGQVGGIFPDVYRGGKAGEVYISSWFPDWSYKVSFSADTGHTFKHVHISEPDTGMRNHSKFMSDREPGVFYIIRNSLVYDFTQGAQYPYGEHEKICIEYYRDYGETLEATFCHDVYKDYEYEEILCDNTTFLDAETVNQNSIKLQWTNSVNSSSIRGFHVYKNNMRITSELLTIPVYLDENLPNGDYEYYVKTFYKEGCVSDSSNRVMETIGVGVKEIEELEGVKVYPNPTTGELNIEYGILNNEVFDVYGRLQKSYDLTILQSYGLLDISHLQTGIYFVKIVTEKGVAVRKVVKY